ncbi:hypothetical protein [Streptomyces sp. AC495_CC817]|uniref:hypothetical protein n=1 Tax=Streptomyces sp. AC495_CC817 TaxID=2823900 RepID=UPI001C2674B0|nr:hypothetical protein [Streptomyces sp. AC495_CC817]
MRITLHEVSKGHALPLTSLEFHSGAVRYALAETEQRPTVLGLIASGRMRPETGRVTIDGTTNNRMLRRMVALVDAPDVSDPHADIALAGVVGEELMFAGRRATPVHARRWLNELGYGELASVPIGNVDPAARVRILCELAVLREGTEGIVLVSPDRHGGSPDGWWRIAGEFADRGYAMLVILGGSAAVALERMQEIDAVNASGPIAPLVLDVDADVDVDVDAEAVADPHAEQDPDAEQDARPEPDTEPGADVEPEAAADPGAGRDPGAEQDADAELDPHAEQDPDVEPAAAPAWGLGHSPSSPLDDPVAQGDGSPAPDHDSLDEAAPTPHSDDANSPGEETTVTDNLPSSDEPDEPTTPTPPADTTENGADR